MENFDSVSFTWRGIIQVGMIPGETVFPARFVCSHPNSPHLDPTFAPSEKVSLILFNTFNVWNLFCDCEINIIHRSSCPFAILFFLFISIIVNKIKLKKPGRRTQSIQVGENKTKGRICAARDPSST